MKKILTLLVITFTMITLSAQDLKIGISLAPSFNFNKEMTKDTNGNYITTGTSKGTGWKGGIVADFPFADNYYLHSGFLVHQKAFNLDDVKNTVTTLEIPLAVKLISNEFASNMAFTVTFGGTFDINVAAKSTEAGVEIDNIENTNTFGFSFVPAAGVLYDLGFGELEAGLSYHLGLVDISKGEQTKVTPKHLAIDFKFYF